MRRSLFKARNFKMNTKTWKWFRYDQIFNIKTFRDGANIQNSADGSIPYVGASCFNNGVTNYVKAEKYICSNKITVSRNGSIGCAFFQSKNFVVSPDDIRIFELKNRKLDQYVGIFLCCLIEKEKYRYAYGRKFGTGRMNVQVMKLPAIKTGNGTFEPDWGWIEKYVKETIIPKLPKRTKEIWQNKFNPKPVFAKKIQLNITQWQWFRYDEIFEIKKGKRLTKADMQDGDIPYIGAIDSNNGISAYISNDEHLHQGNTITVSYNGSIAEAFYQTTKFWATDDVNVLYPKFALNRYIAMFLITLIHREKYRFNYGRKWDKELMESSLIKLPAVKIAPNEYEPDWQFMEDYIKSLPYSSCL